MDEKELFDLLQRRIDETVELNDLLVNMRNAVYASNIDEEHKGTIDYLMSASIARSMSNMFKDVSNSAFCEES